MRRSLSIRGESLVDLLQLVQHCAGISTVAKKFVNHSAGLILEIDIALIAGTQVRSVLSCQRAPEKIVGYTIRFFIRPRRTVTRLPAALYVEPLLAFGTGHEAGILNGNFPVFASR